MQRPPSPPAPSALSSVRLPAFNKERLRQMQQQKQDQHDQQNGSDGMREVRDYEHRFGRGSIAITGASRSTQYAGVIMSLIQLEVFHDDRLRLVHSMSYSPGCVHFLYPHLPFNHPNPNKTANGPKQSAWRTQESRRRNGAPQTSPYIHLR